MAPLNLSPSKLKASTSLNGPVTPELSRSLIKRVVEEPLELLLSSGHKVVIPAQMHHSRFFVRPILLETEFCIPRKVKLVISHHEIRAQGDTASEGAHVIHGLYTNKSPSPSRLWKILRAVHVSRLHSVVLYKPLLFSKSRSPARFILCSLNPFPHLFFNCQNVVSFIFEYPPGVDNT